MITFQNGVDSVERLAPILGDDVTIAGATYVVTKIAAPGVIRHTGTMAIVRCGRLDRRPDAVLAGYVEQMKAANIDITLADNMLARPLEEVRGALGHVRHDGKHAPVPRCHPR